MLPDEQEAFDYFSAVLRDEWLPFGELEKFYLDRIIDCAWRLRRASRLETSILLALCDKIRLADAASSSQENNPDATLGRAYLRGTTSLGKLSRHERQIERSLAKATRQLDILQYSRNIQCNTFYARNLRKFPAPGDTPRKEEHQFNRSRPLKDYED